MELISNTSLQLQLCLIALNTNKWADHQQLLNYLFQVMQLPHTYWPASFRHPLFDRFISRHFSCKTTQRLHAAFWEFKIMSKEYLPQPVPMAQQLMRKTAITSCTLSAVTASVLRSFYRSKSNAFSIWKNISFSVCEVAINSKECFAKWSTWRDKCQT